MTGWAIPFLVSLAVCGLMVRIGPRDAPDGRRKLQARPVASGGGLGIAAGHLVALGAGLTLADGFACRDHWLCGGPPALLLVPVLAALAALALGLRDDVRAVPSGLKLVVLAALSLAAVAAFWWLFDRAFPGVRPLSVSALALVAGGGLWLFVMLNAVNFMDGSNGLATGSIAIMGLAFGALSAPVAGLVPAILGFLVFNLSGRLYAGDAGALYLGAWIGGLGLIGAFTGQFSIWIPPLVALPFLTDVLMTLAWRARRGEPVMQPHRMHAYQLLRRAGWGHLPVAALWWAMTAACGGLAVLVGGRGALAEGAAFAGALVLSMALWLWQRRVYGARLGLNRPG